MSASSIEMEIAATIVRSHIATMNLVSDPSAPRVILRVSIAETNLVVTIDELNAAESRAMPLSDVPDYLINTYRYHRIVLFSITDANAGAA